jgi:hypothetical protein
MLDARLLKSECAERESAEGDGATVLAAERNSLVRSRKDNGFMAAGRHRIWVGRWEGGSTTTWGLGRKHGKKTRNSQSFRLIYETIFSYLEPDTGKSQTPNSHIQDTLTRIWSLKNTNAVQI